MTDPQTIGALAIGCGVGLDVIKTQINNLFTPTTEHLGKYFQKRIERIFIIGDKACKKLMERGVTETRAVSDKLVIQIMESGSREGDDEDGEAMTDLWANLLASAANPNYKEEIPPGFPEILRQLSPVEARILDKLYGRHVEGRNPQAVYPNIGYPVNPNFTIYNGNDFAMWVNHLEALGLLKVDYGMNADKQTYPRDLIFTKLGYAFVCAVWTPGKTPEHMANGFYPSVGDKLLLNTGK